MRIRLVIIFSLFVANSFAQLEGSKEIWLEGRFKTGFLAAHRSIMGHIPVEHAFAGEVSYLFQAKGQKNWHSSRRYPTYGLTGFFGTAGNRELLGHYFGSYVFMNFPLVKHKGYSLSLKTGLGLGYGTKVYDQEDNILSIALSSHFNSMIVAGLESRLKLGNNSLSLSLDMTHFSNGAIKVPNLGLNLPYLSVGYGRRIQKSNYCDSCPVAGLGYKNLEFGFVAIGSAQEIFPTGGGKLGVFGLNLVARKYFNRRSGLELSFDVMSKQSIMNFNPDVEKSQLDILQLGLFAGYLVPMDRFQIVIGMGAYVRDKYKPVDFLYHRVGIRYVFYNGINLNLVLKSHWARADYVEYGIGYTIGR